MTLPGAPIPKVASLIQALTAPVFSCGALFSDSAQHLVRPYWRGRLALAAGIEAIRKAANATRVTIWLPDYFCNEALEPLRASPAKLRFYPISDDLSPDWSALNEAVMDCNQPEVFVLVHYFGFPNATLEAKSFCSRRGMILLEDAAHMLAPHSGMGMGDLIIYSQRKLLPIPSGAVLVMPASMQPHLDDGPGYPSERNIVLWICYRLIQMLLVRLRFPWHALRPYLVGSSASEREGHSMTSEQWSCAPYTLRLFSLLVREFDEIILKRRRNYAALAAWVDGSRHARPLFPSLGDGVCPYVFPLLVPRHAGRVLTILESKGISASQWPDFPPEVLENRTAHAAALHIHDNLLLLPVHQSLTPRQVDWMGRQLCDALRYAE